MYLKYVEINRRKAFEHLVELKRQDKNTFTVDGNVFSYVTKRGVTKKNIKRLMDLKNTQKQNCFIII